MNLKQAVENIDKALRQAHSQGDVQAEFLRKRLPKIRNPKLFEKRVKGFTENE